MAKVLIQGIGALSCPHQFPIPAQGSATLTVGGVTGAGVLTQKAVKGPTPACKVTDTQGPPVIVHCTNVTSISAASKLTVGGDPVVLDSEQGETDGTPSSPITAKALQNKLTAT